MTQVSQAEFARLKGVSRKTVTQWKNQGRLVVCDGLVDVEATQAQLQNAAGSKAIGQAAPVTPRVTTPVTQVTPDADAADRDREPAHTWHEPQPHGGELKRRRKDEEPVEVTDADQFLAELLSGKVHKLADSERVKEGALALKQVLAARQAAGQLVELVVAEAVLFEHARAARDSWINWPSRVGPLIAADLDLPADQVTEVLTAHVQSHLAELGEPDADFRPGTDQPPDPGVP